MIIRQVKEKQFEHLHNALMMKAHAEPLEARYFSKVKNDADYLTKFFDIAMLRDAEHHVMG